MGIWVNQYMSEQVSKEVHAFVNERADELSQSVSLPVRIVFGAGCVRMGFGAGCGDGLSHTSDGVLQ